MNNPVNVIYLTNRCNFKCSYCYEHQAEKDTHEDCTDEQIDRYIENMVATTSPEVQQYNTCLFGGEPFLNVSGMKHFIDTMIPILEKENKSCSIEVITNGSLVHNYVDLLREWILNTPRIFYNLCFSYDGSCQYRRTTSDIVERNMHLMQEKEIPFSISYTVSTENKDLKILTKDVLECYRYLQNPYDRDHYHSKMRINVDNSVFPGDEKTKYHNTLRKWGAIMFRKYRIPMCQWTCAECKRCDFSNTGKNYMVGSNIVKEPMYTDKTFDHF